MLIKLKKIALLALAMILVAGSSENAEARKRLLPFRNQEVQMQAQMAAVTPWNGNFMHQAYGAPVALVVPPNANTSRQYGWGVSQSIIMPLGHQYNLVYPGANVSGYGPYHATPRWPQNSSQFGVYYLRAPW